MRFEQRKKQQQKKQTTFLFSNSHDNKKEKRHIVLLYASIEIYNITQNMAFTIELNQKQHELQSLTMTQMHIKISGLAETDP